MHGAKLVAQVHTDLLLYFILLVEQLADTLWATIVLLQGAQFATQRGKAKIIGVVDVEVDGARIVGVEQAEGRFDVGHGQHRRQLHVGDGLGGLGSDAGKVLYLEEFHLVEGAMVGERSQ